MGYKKIKRDDKVVVIAGDHKGSEGKVVKVIRDQNKAIVEGVNLIKKHAKPSAQNPQGGIIEKEASVHISNVSHIDPKTDQPTRVGYRLLDDGRKVRFAKGSGEVIDA